ncbi:hypothetical protein [Massilia sp. WG5]|uniref:hypothetical protein n=1 Tax=Massilia sp. WG5 TaxID=1707785 RepID=UPI000ABCD576|nr:hypothetical protein [Massilia sp. WG5]
MLNLLNDFEPRLVLHAGVLILGLATFVGLILYTQCPRCGWLEWISDRSASDDAE